MIYGSELDCPIVGFEFTGDALLKGEFVPLRQGLTVLYGLNGAGKTRLLRGIRAALTGVRDDVEVGMVIRARADESRTHWAVHSERPRPLSIALAQAIAATGIESLHGDRLRYDDYGTSPAERSLNAARASEVISSYIGIMAGDTDPEFTDEVLESKLFLLVPTGTKEYPAWDAWAVADLALPAASAVQAELDSLQTEFDDVSDDDEEAWYEALDEMNEIASARALFGSQGEQAAARRRSRYVVPQRFVSYCVGELHPHSIRGLEIAGDVDLGFDLLDLDADPAVTTQDYLASIIATLHEANSHVDDPGSLTGLSAAMRGTSRHALERNMRYLASTRPGPAELHELIEKAVADTATDLSRLANQALTRVLPGAPVVALEITPPALRIAIAATKWCSYRTENASKDVWRYGPGLDLADLSSAERQWATRSINEAIHDHRRTQLGIDPLRPAVWLADEPEAALHRAAEAQMVAALVSKSKEPQNVIVTATHSPAMLDAPTAHLVEVHRGAGHYSHVRALNLAEREALSGLGLTPSDLLRWPRVILLVEGIQDEVLLDAFLGDRLRSSRVKVLPMHGGAKLSHTIDSQVLFDHTNAHLFALLDNTNATLVADIWNAAQEAAIQGDLERAKNIVVEGITDKINTVKNTDGEAGYLRSWLTRALSAGLNGRITPTGLSRADIIEYLPVERFVPNASSWRQLRAAHAADLARHPGANVPKDFKKWLARNYSADFSPASLHEAAQGIDVPQEFERLMKEIEARSTMPRTDESSW